MVASSLPNDISDFINFDDTFDENYHQIIQGGIDEVMGIRTDNVVIDEITELTQIVNTSLTKG